VLVGVLAVAFVVNRESRPSRPEPFAGTVTAARGTRWSQSREARVETVLLGAGDVWIVVRKQMPDERFLVETPDAEIEVRGTVFNVHVEDRSTRHVYVAEGLVVLRLRGRRALELAAGQTWDLETPEATPARAPVAPTPSSSAPLRPSHTFPPAAATPPDTESADYEGAMALYRGAHYGEAAEAFRQFAAQHRSSGLMEDATFLEALSLTRDGHADSGSVAAWRHLAEFPNSFHKKEASVLVARAARDRGDCKEARRFLAPWLDSDADATIREAMGVCAER
jgi:hypothetical protein